MDLYKAIDLGVRKLTRVTQRTVALTYNIITNIHKYSVTSEMLYNEISRYFLFYICHEIEIKQTRLQTNTQPSINVKLIQNILRK